MVSKFTIVSLFVLVLALLVAPGAQVAARADGPIAVCDPYDSACDPATGCPIMMSEQQCVQVQAAFWEQQRQQWLAHLNGNIIQIYASWAINWIAVQQSITDLWIGVAMLYISIDDVLSGTYAWLFYLLLAHSSS